MPSASFSQRYNSVARSLHWASALLVVAGFAIGLTIDVPPKPWYPAYLNAHVLIGLAVLALALARLAWRASHPAPAAPAGTSPLMAKVIKLGHGALYLMMIAVPLIGLAPLFTRGRGINFGLFQIASPIGRMKDWVGPATDVHEFAAYALIALALGHAAAAIYHQVVLKDGVLLRMMPEKRA